METKKKVSISARKLDRLYTYRDYKAWPDDERWELVEGVAWDMCAAPSMTHQGLSMRLSRRIGNFLEGKSCLVFAAPFDVFFPARPEQEEDEVDTVVQPDLTVVCDKSKLTERGCFGAPDMAVEILSPYTQRKDLNEKFRLYERSGVREYWIIDPAAESVQLYVLGEKDQYRDGEILVKEGILESSVLKGFRIDLADLFSSL